MHPAIRVENLSKHYKLGERQQGYKTLRESISSAVVAPFRRFSNPKSETRNSKSTDFWALKDVSFEVQPGEVVGIIGRNGAGKSTLLKILSRITEPTSGRIELRGRVGSLLEVGTGFHPELTGRENIFMNGSILGMTQREVAKKFDEIVDFSGIEDFLDTPVKRYSSGMYVRLAFAVAAHLEPEILIVDEVLAVGDSAFQQKCLGRMHDIAKSGRTVFFVSHNLAAVENLCTRVIVLSDGTLRFDSEPETAISTFLGTQTMNSQRSEGASIDLYFHPNRRSGCTKALKELVLSSNDTRGVATIPAGGPLTIEVQSLLAAEQRPGCGIVVFLCDHGQRLLMFHSAVNSSLSIPKCKRAVVQCDIPALPLVPGVYDIDIALCTSDSILDYVERATSIQVIESDYFGTGVLPKRTQAKILQVANWSILSTSDIN